MTVSPIQGPKIRNKGFIRAQIAQNIVAIPASIASVGILGAMRKVSNLSKEESAVLTHAARKGLRDTGLFEKGIKVHKINELPLKSIIEQPYNLIQFLMGKVGKKDKQAVNAIGQEVKEGRLFKILTKNMSPEMKDSVLEYGAKGNSLMFKLGLNACYLPKANKIITPDKSLQTIVFHEMGHALNNNGGIILKSLQKMRSASAIIPSIVLLTSLLNKRKTTEETKQNDSAIQKGADFVKRNAGKLTALSFVPMVLEEGLASLRGQGVAKKLVQDGALTKDLLKKIKLTNLGGFSSYVIAAVVAALSAKFAIQVKDKIQEKYEANKIAKFEAKNNKQ